jgi:flagellar motility protein MotE (MotC chaperone)
MKKFILLFFSLTNLLDKNVKAQGTGNIFNQGSSKIKLMLAQITGYQTYLQEIKTGYNIAENGLNTAKELKGGTFDLHTTYFNSLEQIPPAIKNNSKAKACVDLQQQIIDLFTMEIAWQQKQQLMNIQEIAYIKSVYENLLSKCKLDMDELTNVLTPGKLQMTDHQRLERIDHVYTAMQDKKAFAASFTGHCRQMATDRKKAKLDNDQLKKLYGVG